jgi:hypothetical protein
VKVIVEHYEAGRLPQNAASVVFKVPGKEAAQKLLEEMWVAGNKFRALPYIPDKADTLCGTCSQWGHSEFRCQQSVPTCTLCAGSHRTVEHRCEVATCGKIGKVCPHTEMKCPNCGGGHPAQDARCKAKRTAIGIARSRRQVSWPRGRPESQEQCQPGTHRELSSSCDMAGDPPAAEWTEDKMDTEMEPSGTAPPVAA